MVVNPLSVVRQLAVMHRMFTGKDVHRPFHYEQATNPLTDLTLTQATDVLPGMYWLNTGVNPHLLYRLSAARVWVPVGV